MRILLLSAYDAMSHQQWHKTLIATFTDYEWTVLTLPARYFSWRIRGNSLTWAFQHRDILEAHYDLILSTSMVDLSALRGFVPALSQIPTLVYFHENQFAYPENSQQMQTVEPAILSLYTALCADKVLFNSEYNRDSFLQGAADLLKRLPDHVPAGLVQQLAGNSEVLPVPLAEDCFMSRGENSSSATSPLSLLWNHRWEYDKAPEDFFQAIKDVLENGVPLVLNITGQQFRQQPKIFAEMKGFLEGHPLVSLQSWGFIENNSDYKQVLASSDVVVSTAIHDFQGLAVLEGVAAGCVPLLPDSLCYPEWFAKEYLYRPKSSSKSTELLGLSEALIQLSKAKAIESLPPVPDISFISIEALKNRYESVFIHAASKKGQNYNSQNDNEPVL